MIESLITDTGLRILDTFPMVELEDLIRRAA